MRSRALAVVWAAGAALAAPLASLDAQRPLSVGIAGGVSIPQGDLGDAVDVGWHALATVGLSSLMQPMGLRLDAAYNRFAFSDDALGDDARETASSLTLNLGYRLPMTDSPLSPYLITGLGGYRTTCSGEGVSCEASTDFGWNAGLGTKLYVLGFRSFLEARFHSASREGGAVRFVPVTFGVTF